MTTTDPTTILQDACRLAGITADDAEPIRIGENAIFRLPNGIVARISQPGQHAAAHRELAIARWLAHHELRAVHPIDNLPQPLDVADRAITWWDELPPHRPGTPTEVAATLRQLHALPPPDFAIGHLDPFVRVADRINHATILTPDEQAWLRDRRTELERRYRALAPGLPRCVIHGDASDTNLAVTDDGTSYLIDLERCSLGPPEWDLTSMAVELGYNWITPTTYHDFAHAYGHDVTTWVDYPLLRDIRELRMTTWLAQQATENPEHHAEARHRLECLQGHHGDRPWAWSPL